MNIAIVGSGAIGSTFTLYLWRAGHCVTAIVWGKRLEQRKPDSHAALAFAGLTFGLMLRNKAATREGLRAGPRRTHRSHQCGRDPAIG